MRKTFTKASVYCSLLLSLAGAAHAQTDTSTEFKPHGNLWGYTFGDLAYKGNADNLTGTQNAPAGARGGSNQYTGMPGSANTFQFRRIYLGYNYDISPKFSAEFLLAAEDDFGSNTLTAAGATSTTGSITQTAPGGAGSSGDVLADGKFAPYVKFANLRWKNIFKNSDLVFGQQATPGFAKTGRNEQTSEEVWGYRSIERTISDIRRTPSFDMGASLQGWFDKKGNYGYMLMVGNGNQSKPAVNSFKSLYGDAYAKFFDKRLIVDLYADYTKIAWGVWDQGTKVGVESPNGPLYESRNMTKLFIAWNTPKLTVGFEAFNNTFLGGLKVTESDGNVYYRTFSAMAESFFVRGRILSAKNGDPRLNFFARFDNYDPSNGLTNATNSNNGQVKSVAVNSGVSNYDPYTKEQFITAGIDYMPFKNVHIMPNVWLNTYASSLSPTGSNSDGIAYTKIGTNEVSGVKGTDAVYRLTFYYIYNGKQGTTKY